MKYLRKILKGVSLTAALFVFQACYGTPQDEVYFQNVAFRVVSSDDGQPIPNVDIMYQYLNGTGFNDVDWFEFGKTDSQGLNIGSLEDRGFPTMFRFKDANSAYVVKDTVLTRLYEADTVDIVLSKLN
jgi:hypothetical protein